MNKKIITKSFDELTSKELHDIIQLRLEVFVVEQNAIYQDLDGLDFDSMHYFIKDDDQIVSYIRTLPKGLKFEDSSSLGRVVTNPSYRNKGLSRLLIQKGIEDLLLTELVITIEGQSYLKSFYESFGFEVISALYLVDGIDHYKMRLTKPL
ncbi:MAG: GNAT family N-acetyltransferase [Acholeplasma sp.]|nr:GNAT family N-acetyltransferase [Acholeplasma sp.]